MSISYNDIPAKIYVPGIHVEVDNSKANQGLNAGAFKTLITAQKLSTGAAAEHEVKEIFSLQDAIREFGRGSMAANMAEQIFKKSSPSSIYFACFDDDGSDVQASGNIAVTGPATESGTIALLVGGRRVTVSVTSGDTASTIATAIAAVIPADVSGAAKSDLPVTSAVNGGDDSQVDVTARHKGSCGNEINIQHSYYPDEKLPAGVGLTITQLSGGTGEPNYADLWAALDDTHYKLMLIPYTASAVRANVETELEGRANSTRQIPSFAVCSAYRGTLANGQTLVNGENSEFLAIPVIPDIPCPGYEWTAALIKRAAAKAARDPARPFQRTIIDEVLAPKKGLLWSERNALLRDGGTSVDVNDFGEMILDRLVTTYTENSSGAPDESYKDANTLFIAEYIRSTTRNFLLTNYPDYKLAKDGTRFGPGQAVVTPLIIKADMLGLFREWETIGLVEDAKDFLENLVVEIDGTDPNRLNVLLPPNFINQFRVGAIKLQFRR